MMNYIDVIHTVIFYFYNVYNIFYNVYNHLHCGETGLHRNTANTRVIG